MKSSKKYPIITEEDYLEQDKLSKQEKSKKKTLLDLMIEEEDEEE